MYLLTGFALCFVLFAVARPRTFLFDKLNRLFRRLFMKSQALEPVQVDDGWTVIPGDDARQFCEWIHEDDFKRPQWDGIEPSLGCHVLIEMYGCDPDMLEIEDKVSMAMNDAAKRSEATVVTSSFHEFKPYGVSGAVIIQESHYTIHTWPEHRYAAIDLFYCGESVLVDEAVRALREHFKPSKTRFLVVRRGLQSEVEKEAKA